MLRKIKNLNIALTNRCNLHCRHCDIWRQRPKKDISLDNVKKVLVSGVLDSKADITLTGGEPFLHRNFLRIAGCILDKRPGCLKTISTNGTMRDKTLKFLDEYYRDLPPGFSLHISVDGINKHDMQRGKSLGRILNNIKLIRKKFPQASIKLKLTITPLNYTDILPTYKYACAYNLGFKIKLVENAKNYTNRLKTVSSHFDKEMKKSVVKDLLWIHKDMKDLNPKEAGFIKNTIKFLLKKSGPVICKTPFNRVFIMPEGWVYSCIHFDSIGNLNKSSLDTIWNSKKAEYIRARIAGYGCKKCVSYHGFSEY